MRPLPKEIWYFAARDDTNKGPISKTELQQLIQSGEIQPSTLVWSEGMIDWVRAADVKGLITKTNFMATDAPALPPVGDLLQGVAIDKVASIFNSPRFYRNTGNIFGIASVLVFFLSVVGYPFGMTWFSGGAMLGGQSILVHGIGAILQGLKRLIDIQTKPPSS